SMKSPKPVSAARWIAGITALCLGAACQSQPTALVVEAVAPVETVEPVAVATELDTTEPDGPITNQWGGVIPDAKPTTPIDNGALGEIE
ncbi:hypothetical protein, partial [Hyphomonas sp. UBA3601]|uniref:hypothetical protein n=2 Tax=Hyphomonas TaxID=85 RepID=UPI0025BF16EA